MCDRVWPAATPAGDLLRLCPDYAVHIVKAVSVALVEGDPDSVGIAASLEDSKLSANVFRRFEPASYLVFESDYFDLDYRSEFSHLHETTFARKSPQTLRVHLFGESEQTLEDVDGIFDAIRELAPTYLGYVVLRPQSPGMIGRTICPPRSTNLPLKGTTLQHRVRTVVMENLTLFGTDLSCTGVPFMEQDGHLLRCSHVSGWICHYTAVLKGIVPRRPTAAFHRATSGYSALSRPYPSRGLAILGIGPMLNALDLPPDARFETDFGLSRPAQWHDRASVWKVAKAEAERAEQQPGVARSMEARRFWAREDFTAMVCRYLNSGFPLVIGRGDHTVVACGYLRASYVDRERLREAPANVAEHLAPMLDDVDPSTVVALVVQNDQTGPYRVVVLDDDFIDRLWSETTGVFVPLPRGLWLPGDAAEAWGAQLLKTRAETQLREFESVTTNWALDPTEIEERQEALRRFVSGMQRASATVEGRYAIRTYAMLGTDFKRSLLKRLDRRGAGSGQLAVGLAHFPKYVWAVEAVDRRLRSRSRPYVCATTVLDASAPFGAEDDASVSELLTHLPGMISSTAFTMTTGTGEWHPATAKPYRGGRWDPSDPDFTRLEVVAARRKGATSE